MLVDKDTPILRNLTFQIGKNKKRNHHTDHQLNIIDLLKPFIHQCFRGLLFFLIFFVLRDASAGKKKIFHCWRRFLHKNVPKKIFSF
jgi:hypothetical protein